MEHRALGLIDERAIAPATANVTRLGNCRACFGSLVGCRPQRRADLHSRDFAIGSLVNIWHASLLVLLSEPRIERPAEVHVAGVATGGDDDALPRLDIQGITLVCYDDPNNPPRVVILPDDTRHLMFQKNFRALFSRALRQSPHKPRTIASATRGDEFARDVPFDRHERSGDSRSSFRTDRPLDELD